MDKKLIKKVLNKLRYEEIELLDEFLDETHRYCPDKGECSGECLKCWIKYIKQSEELE